MGNYLNMHVCFSSLRTFLHVHTINKTETQLPLTGTAVVSLDLHWHATVYTSPGGYVPSAVWSPIQFVWRDYSCMYESGLVIGTAEANPTFPSRDSQCQSSLTCWHLPQRRRLCAALITVTAGSQITKNPCAVSICSGRSQQMHARCTHNRTQSCGVEARHTHTSGVDTEGQKVQTPY